MWVTGQIEAMSLDKEAESLVCSSCRVHQGACKGEGAGWMSVNGPSAYGPIWARRAVHIEQDRIDFEGGHDRCEL